MFQVVVGALRYASRPVVNLGSRRIINAINGKPPAQLLNGYNNFASLAIQNAYKPLATQLLEHFKVQPVINQSIRSVTKYTIRKGKRTTVKAVLKRFYRLNWGGWVRTLAGRHKKLWKKTSARKRRLRQHVFCNATQCTLLDKMVTSYWRRPKYYVDDPYEPYHTREEWKFTYRKPRPYFPKE